MFLATGFVSAVALLVPAVRNADTRAALATWSDRALEFSLARLAAWFPKPGATAPPPAPGPDLESVTPIGTVESLPPLSKGEVLQRYGEPRAREAGRWFYPRFSILFQDDSVASLLVRDRPEPD